jgi:hypothetical protein
MKWVEVIHLRITVRETEQIVLIVQQLAGEAMEDRSCREVKMYRCALVDTDLSILLYHDTIKMEKNGSSLGLRITSALKEYGMVNHMTWFEVHSS